MREMLRYSEWSVVVYMVEHLPVDAFHMPALVRSTIKRYRPVLLFTSLETARYSDASQRVEMIPRHILTKKKVGL